MHSPGGIPGVSPAVTWNASAAERSWSVETNSLMKTAAYSMLSLTAVGAAYRAGLLGLAARGILVQGTKARTWAAYNLYKEYGDLKHWARGGKFEWGLSLRARPITSMYFPYPLVVPFPWVGLNPVEESSSHGLVQNGGSSAPPLYFSKRAIKRKLESRKGSTTNSAHGFRPGKAPARRKRCPYHWRHGGWTERGYWTTSYKRGPRCIHRAGHRGPHKK